MARTNLHDLASKLLLSLNEVATDGRFEGKLRDASVEAGLNSVRSAEAVKLLEQIGRIEVVQRGRRGRDTIIDVLSTEPVTLKQAQDAKPAVASKKTVRIDYENVGRQVVDRLIELGRNDALRAAQVEAFSTEIDQARERIAELESRLAEAEERETEVRVKLRAAEGSLERAEENLRRAFNQGRPGAAGVPSRSTDMPDEDARAVLDILRAERG